MSMVLGSIQDIISEIKYLGKKVTNEMDILTNVTDDNNENHNKIFNDHTCTQVALFTQTETCILVIELIGSTRFVGTS